MKNKAPTQTDEAKYLANLNVETLRDYLGVNVYPIDVLVRAIGFCKARGVISHEKILRAQINRQRKAKS